jgi:hypothetical protein
VTKPLLKAVDDHKAARAVQFDFRGYNIFDNHLSWVYHDKRNIASFDYELKMGNEIK